MSADKDIDSSAKQKKSNKPAMDNQKSPDGDFISIFEQERDDPLKPKPQEVDELPDEAEAVTADEQRDTESGPSSKQGSKEVAPGYVPSKMASAMLSQFDEADSSKALATSDNQASVNDIRPSGSAPIPGTQTPSGHGAVYGGRGVDNFSNPGYGLGSTMPPRGGYVAGQTIQPTVSSLGYPPASPSALPPPTMPSPYMPTPNPLTAQMPWQKAQQFRMMQPNIGVQQLRGYQQPQGQVVGQAAALLPQNPYAFLNEQSTVDPAIAKRKSLIWTGVFAMMFILVVSGVAALIVFGKDDASKGPNANNGENGTSMNSGPSLNFQMVDPQHKDEIVTGAPMQQVNGADGAVILVTNVDRDYSGGAAGSSGASNELVKIDILLGNANKTQSMVFESPSFALASTSGVVVWPKDGFDVGVQTVSLNPGMKGKLTLVYELGKGMTDFALLYNRTYTEGGIRYTMFSAVGLTGSTSSMTPEDVMDILQSQKTQGGA